jgi:hypothetical protein
MHRLTARLLLILLLVSIFAPLALAIAAPAPHACCMRKPMHDGSTHNSSFQAPANCCNHDCCRPLTVSYWAQIRPAAKARVTPPTAALQSEPRSIPRIAGEDPAHSGRAPPQFSNA